MNVIPSSTPKSNDALIALAVLGQAGRHALAALLDRQLAEADWVEVKGNPATSEIKGQLRLTRGKAVEILASLEREDLPRYRHLHERAIDLLATRFQTGDEDAEPGLIAVFERLANRLLTDDPDRLMALVAQFQALPLKLPSSRHRCVYFEAAALRKAEDYAGSVAVSEALLSEAELDSWVRGRTLNSRAICYRVTGWFEEAFADYRQSLAIFQRAGYRLDEGLVLLNMGITAYDLQNYDEAETYLSQAEIVFEEIGSLQWLASVHNELGLVHRDRGHWAESLTYFEKFIARRRVEGAHDQVGRGLNNIGEVLLFQGRLDEAIAALLESLEKMTTRVYRVDTHVNLGAGLPGQGQPCPSPNCLSRSARSGIDHWPARFSTLCVLSFRGCVASPRG